MQLNELQAYVVNNFIKKCNELPRGKGRQLSIGSKRVLVYKDEDYSCLYDVHTYNHGHIIDDTVGVHEVDLPHIIIDGLEGKRPMMLL